MTNIESIIKQLEDYGYWIDDFESEDNMIKVYYTGCCMPMYFNSWEELIEWADEALD